MDGKIKMTAQEIADLLQDTLESMDEDARMAGAIGDNDDQHDHEVVAESIRFFLSQIYGGE